MKANVGAGFRALLEEKLRGPSDRNIPGEQTYHFQPVLTESEARAYAPLTLAFL